MSTRQQHDPLNPPLLPIFKVEPPTGVLQPGQRCNVQIYFTPSAEVNIHLSFCPAFSPPMHCCSIDTSHWLLLRSRDFVGAPPPLLPPLYQSKKLFSLTSYIKAQSENQVLCPSKRFTQLSRWQIWRKLIAIKINVRTLSYSCLTCCLVYLWSTQVSAVSSCFMWSHVFTRYTEPRLVIHINSIRLTLFIYQPWINWRLSLVYMRGQWTCYLQYDTHECSVVYLSD